jgi:hypothetical protein
MPAGVSEEQDGSTIDAMSYSPAVTEGRAMAGRSRCLDILAAANVCLRRVSLRWQEGWGGSWRGWDGLSLAADVCRFDAWRLGEPGRDGRRRVEVTGVYWGAYVTLDPVGGWFDTAAAAQAAAEAAYDALPG